MIFCIFMPPYKTFLYNTHLKNVHYTKYCDSIYKKQGKTPPAYVILSLTEGRGIQQSPLGPLYI